MMTDPNEIKAKEVVGQTLDKLAQSPSINLSEASAEKMQSAVVKEMSAVIANQTNQEPWYQSRVTWGALVSVALPILGALGVATDVIEPDELIALGMAAGSVVGGIITLYGRWVARKPIGE